MEKSTSDRNSGTRFHQSILAVPTWVMAEPQACQRLQVRHHVLEDAALLHEVAFPGADPVRAVDFPVENTLDRWVIRLATLHDDGSVAARACPSILLTAVWQLGHGHGRSIMSQSRIRSWHGGGIVLTKMFSISVDLDRGC